MSSTDILHISRDATEQLLDKLSQKEHIIDLDALTCYVASRVPERSTIKYDLSTSDLQIMALQYAKKLASQLAEELVGNIPELEPTPTVPEPPVTPELVTESDHEEVIVSHEVDTIAEGTIVLPEDVAASIPSILEDAVVSDRDDLSGSDVSMEEVPESSIAISVFSPTPPESPLATPTVSARETFPFVSPPESTVSSRRSSIVTPVKPLGLGLFTGSDFSTSFFGLEKEGSQPRVIVSPPTDISTELDDDDDYMTVPEICPHYEEMNAGASMFPSLPLSPLPAKGGQPNSSGLPRRNNYLYDLDSDEEEIEAMLQANRSTRNSRRLSPPRAGVFASPPASPKTDICPSPDPEERIILSTRTPENTSRVTASQSPSKNSPGSRRSNWPWGMPQVPQVPLPSMSFGGESGGLASASPEIPKSSDRKDATKPEEKTSEPEQIRQDSSIEKPTADTSSKESPAAPSRWRMPHVSNLPNLIANGIAGIGGLYSRQAAKEPASPQAKPQEAQSPESSAATNNNTQSGTPKTPTSPRVTQTLRLQKVRGPNASTDPKDMFAVEEISVLLPEGTVLPPGTYFISLPDSSGGSSPKLHGLGIRTSLDDLDSDSDSDFDAEDYHTFDRKAHRRLGRQFDERLSRTVQNMLPTTSSELPPHLTLNKSRSSSELRNTGVPLASMLLPTISTAGELSGAHPLRRTLPRLDTAPRAYASQAPISPVSPQDPGSRGFPYAGPPSPRLQPYTPSTGRLMSSLTNRQGMQNPPMNQDLSGGFRRRSPSPMRGPVYRRPEPPIAPNQFQPRLLRGRPMSRFQNQQ